MGTTCERARRAQACVKAPRKPRAQRWFPLLAVALGACGGAGDRHAAPAALRECASFDAGAVTSIAQVVERMNRLPHPVSGPCFVASLPRPLFVVATAETNSAQPPQGPRDPRIFLMLPGVVAAVVPSGTSARLLELGEWVTATTTLKGELALPATGALEASEPFERLEEKKAGDVTACGLCHANETPHPTVPHGYVSPAFRPKTELTLEALTAEHEACIARDDPSARCFMFHALFDFGPVQQGAFAPEVARFE